MRPATTLSPALQLHCHCYNGTPMRTDALSLPPPHRHAGEHVSASASQPLWGLPSRPPLPVLDWSMAVLLGAGGMPPVLLWFLGQVLPVPVAQVSPTFPSSSPSAMPPLPLCCETPVPCAPGSISPAPWGPSAQEQVPQKPSTRASAHPPPGLQPYMETTVSFLGCLNPGGVTYPYATPMLKSDGPWGWGFYLLSEFSRNTMEIIM